jgi:hypothetical protein
MLAIRYDGLKVNHNIFIYNLLGCKPANFSYLATVAGSTFVGMAASVSRKRVAEKTARSRKLDCILPF